LILLTISRQTLEKNHFFQKLAKSGILDATEIPQIDRQPVVALIIALALTHRIG
jgi:hypothetical protein